MDPERTLEQAVFLVSRARHARMWRRITRVKEDFRSFRVLAFERKEDPPNDFGSFESLGYVEHRNYLKRIPKLLKVWWRIWAATKKSDAVYCFSLDLLCLAWLARCLHRGRPSLVYEVADIYPAMVAQSPKGAILRWMERFLAARCAAVVVTSPAYYSGYFQGVQGMKELGCVVIEHKPDLPRETRARIRPPIPKGNRVVIGNFGVLRDSRSLRILHRIVVEGGGRIELRLRGRFALEVEEEWKPVFENTPGVCFDGPYSSPADLESIYTEVDLVWAATKGHPNAKWQRTTRFSEAIYFKRPTITDGDTQDGILSKEFLLGPTVDLNDEESVVAEILQIQPDDIASWGRNVERVPDTFCFYGDEYPKLIEMIRREDQCRTRGGRQGK